MGIWNIDAARVARVRNRPLVEAVRLWDTGVDSEARQQGAAQRAKVLELYPIERWPELTMEEYALGTEVDDSFCKLMEFRTQGLGGIGGGSALKHMLYRRQDGSWYHRPEYSSEREAWEAIRAGFSRAFQLASEGRWAEIDDIPAIKPGSSLRGKAVYVYFPTELVPIYASPFQAHFFARLRGQGTAPDGVSGSRALFELTKATGHFDGWDTVDIARFLGAWSDPRVGKKIVKIAPGNGAEFWEACRDGGYMCVGWDEVGDLKKFESYEQFRQAFSAEYPDYAPSKATVKANELWTLMELQPGDIVLANQGTERIVGVGEVVEPAYVWRPDRGGPWAFHTVAVDWQDREPWRISPIKKWAMTTVSDVSAEEYKRILQGVETVVDRGATDVPPDPLLAEIASTLERKGQLILYGPPGTGKTYTARRFSVWWLTMKADATEAGSVLGDKEGMRRAEDRLSSGAPSAVGQLTRVTFHPSYTYEDFVEGYKPVPTDTGQLDLRLTDGVFKRFCQAAAADLDRPYLLLIDEINRGNIPKIFGELITLLEIDKRGLTVTLPQSRESFAVPVNVFILGTMNTADRSIKLLDAALRRRFAFIELMPSVEPLAGGKVAGLDLPEFLAGLNRRIVLSEGREKQIGHSFLLGEDGQPVSTPEAFSQRFRYEILPLLQEYAYDDYTELASYLGPKLVNAKEQALERDVLADPQQLLDALTATFQPNPSPADADIGPPMADSQPQAASDTGELQ